MVDSQDSRSGPLPEDPNLIQQELPLLPGEASPAEGASASLGLGLSTPSSVPDVSETAPLGVGSAPAGESVAASHEPEPLPQPTGPIDGAPAAWPQDDPDFRPFADVPGSSDYHVTGEGEAFAVERERPQRRPFVQRRTIWIVVGVLFGIAAVVAVVWAVVAFSAVTVPDFRNSDFAVATADAQRANLTLNQTEQRFDSAPKGRILEQDPPAGQKVRPGSVVNVVVSAGTETFAMPDVTGEGIVLAKGQLEERGLSVDVQTQLSTEPSGTVLMTTPGPNQPVQTGALVRVVISAETTDSGRLQPYDLRGTSFILDPAQVTGPNDVTLEVTRRLHALLNASGATVTDTRSAADSSSPDPARAAKVSTVASATALVGFSVAPDGPAGVRVLSLKKGSPQKQSDTALLVRSTLDALRTAGVSVSSAAVAADKVLEATPAPAERVSLGSAVDKNDAAMFNDPTWVDKIARALYQALGERYGKK